jgi:hypothetical protein
VKSEDNPGAQEWPTLVRRNPIMQAPLRKGKKEETLGRAKGVTRTGRSLLYGLLLIGLAAASSLVYTWERLVVESMLEENSVLEEELILTQKRTETLACEVTELGSLKRIEPIARSRPGMIPIDWEDVVVIEDVEVR